MSSFSYRRCRAGRGGRYSRLRRQCSRHGRRPQAVVRPPACFRLRTRKGPLKNSARLGTAFFGGSIAVKQSLQCIVEPGEAIFIPTNWRHATCNLSPLTLSLGGQGDLGVFPDRELIDAILDDDQATASRLLQSPAASVQRMLRARSKQVIPPVPSSFTRFRPYLANFLPRFFFSRLLRVFTAWPRRF